VFAVELPDVSDYYVGGVARGGAWLAVAYTADGYDHAGVFEGVGELWTEYEESAERIAVDVPVGLESTTAPRANEAAGRELLGDRADAVVGAPVREAARKQRYRTAARVHERKTGRELRRDAFERARLVTAVDEFLTAIEEARPVFVEAHPELCYRAFAGEPMADAPAVAAGYAERMRTLAGFEVDAPPTVQSVAEATAGYDVPIPAVLDAVALGLTVRPGPGQLRTLPAEPPTDDEGLPIRYAYRSETPLQPAQSAE
jgi:predicted RNase H-like nuclease